MPGLARIGGARPALSSACRRQIVTSNNEDHGAPDAFVRGRSLRFAGRPNASAPTCALFGGRNTYGCGRRLVIPGRHGIEVSREPYCPSCIYYLGGLV